MMNQNQVGETALDALHDHLAEILTVFNYLRVECHGSRSLKFSVLDRSLTRRVHWTVENAGSVAFIGEAKPC